MLQRYAPFEATRLFATRLLSREPKGQDRPRAAAIRSKRLLTRIRQNDLFSGVGMIAAVTLPALFGHGLPVNGLGVAPSSELVLASEISPTGAGALLSSSVRDDWRLAPIGAATPTADQSALPAPVESSSTASTVDTTSAADPAIPAQYTVKAGDTVDKIAASFGMTTDQIVRASHLQNAQHIEVGQRLRLREDASSKQITLDGSDHEGFITALGRGAQESQRLTGVPASVTLAQAILETYWGSSYLAREANNYFGIKAYAKDGTDGVVWIDAWEVDDAGRNVNSQEPFRKYNDPAESLVDHGKFFVENSRYSYALEAGNDPREFARRINAAGYATDPAYASKLISYMDRYNLYQWDVAS